MTLTPMATARLRIRAVPELRRHIPTDRNEQCTTPPLAIPGSYDDTLPGKVNGGGGVILDTVSFLVPTIV
jgi:hypothetical protein